MTMAAAVGQRSWRQLLRRTDDVAQSHAAGARVMMMMMSSSSSSSGEAAAQPPVPAAKAPGLEIATKAGPGGRSSVSGHQATIFGAGGFLGRYVVDRIAGQGTRCIVPIRGADHYVRHLKVCGDVGQVAFTNFNLRDEDSIARSIEGSDIVINLIGQPKSTPNYSLEDVHVTGARLVAKVAKSMNVEALVHISMAGAKESSPSARLKSKAMGEAAVLEEFGNAVVLRPCYMVGVEDKILNPLRTIIKNFPRIPLIEGGSAKLQPVNVVDVAKAVEIAAMPGKKSRSLRGKTLDLGGPEVISWHDLINFVAYELREPVNTVDVPVELLTLFSGVVDRIQKSLPFPLDYKPLFSTDDLIEMTQDLTASNDGFSELGIVPSKLEGLVVDHVRSHRFGGYHMGRLKAMGLWSNLDKKKYYGHTAVSISGFGKELRA